MNYKNDIRLFFSKFYKSFQNGYKHIFAAADMSYNFHQKNTNIKAEFLHSKKIHYNYDIIRKEVVHILYKREKETEKLFEMKAKSQNLADLWEL